MNGYKHLSRAWKMLQWVRGLAVEIEGSGFLCKKLRVAILAGKSKQAIKALSHIRHVEDEI